MIASSTHLGPFSVVSITTWAKEFHTLSPGLKGKALFIFKFHAPAIERRKREEANVRFHAFIRPLPFQMDTKKSTYRDSRLLQVQLERHGLAHEDVRIVAALEDSFQLLQLPLGEVGARSPPLGLFALGICQNERSIIKRLKLFYAKKVIKPIRVTSINEKLEMKTHRLVTRAPLRMDFCRSLRPS